jgi:iron(III) transport system ATP-binding protein
VWVGDRRLTAPGSVVPPERRRIGMVFQDGALFPHMTVFENVAYGVVDAPDREARVRRVLEMVDLADYGDRRPDNLSGGQRQRVAIARALAPEPSVLLLDEPFASLDAELRVRVRAEVAALLRGLEITAVFVTHDQDEAFVIGDEVAVMRDGRIVQVGSPSEVYERPVSAWVASFVGEANVLDAEVQATVATTAIGRIETTPGPGGRRRVLVRPEFLVLEDGDDGVVERVEFYGHDTAYTVSVGDQLLTSRALSAPRFAVGDRVTVGYRGGPAPTFDPAADQSVRVP